jgi:hypothetical protein
MRSSSLAFMRNVPYNKKVCFVTEQFGGGEPKKEMQDG